MTPDPMARQKQKERFLGEKLLVEQEWNLQQTKPSSVQQTVPAWLIFSMFFVVIPIAMTFLVEKQLGTLQRLKTMPVPPTYFLVGKLVPYLGINLTQALLMFLVGIYLVPLVGGTGLVLTSNAWLLIPMTISVSIAAISFALFIATIVNTSEQATTIGGTSNLLLGAIGGIMVPTFVMPEMMQNVAKISPMNWGLEGYLDILLKQGNFISIIPEMMKLIVFALVFFGAAILLYRRTSVN
jgi:ABC-2 type transport system permease protein